MRQTVRLFYMLVMFTAFIRETCPAQELVSSDTAEVRMLNKRKFYLYKVSKSETMYGISRKFNIPQDEILEFNPEAKDGLKARMTLWIPAYSSKKTEKKEPVELPVAAVQSKGDERLHIAVLTSLELGKVYTGEADSTDSSAVFEPINRQIQNNLHFVEGVTTAIEKFHSANTGFDLRTTIVDAENDTVQLAKIAWRFRSADVWITNETGPVLEYLNRLSIKSGTQLVSCGINSAEMVHNNGNAIAMLPGSLHQCERMGEFAALKFKNAQGVFLKTATAREVERMKSFKSGWTAKEEVSVRVVDMVKAGVSGMVDSLKKGKKQVVFVPTSNEDMVTNLLVALKDLQQDYDFVVVGLPTWFNFETVDPSLLQKCNTYYFNSGSVPLASDDALQFRQTFRDHYATEPAESAFIGFDAATFLLSERKSYGKDFLNEKDGRRFKGLYADYGFEQVKENGSFENREISVWTFRDYMPERVTR